MRCLSQPGCACCRQNLENHTDWRLSLLTKVIQCYGHDIGGLEGPQISKELLLRWVQLGI